MSGTAGTNGATSGEPTRETTAAPRPAAAYRERLWPALWVWFAVTFLAGLIGVVALPFGTVAGALMMATAFAAFGAMMISWSPALAVADGELVAGQAHIPIDLLGEVTPLDAPAMRHALGPGLDMRAYLCVRGWITGGVRAEVTDAADPTPYWLISSRHPQHLVDAVQRARRPARPTAS
jgi:hypothetical protein